MTKIIELRPRQELLNINFEKYQFSPETVPITHEISLSTKVHHREPSPGQDSLLEARLFAFHNHLFQNPYDHSLWFFNETDDLFVQKLNETPKKVYSTPPGEGPRLYNSTIFFASPRIIVVTTGNNILSILILNKTDEDPQEVTDVIKPGILMAARHIEHNNSLLVILSSIIEENLKKKSKINIIKYKIDPEDIKETLEIIQKQKLIVNGPVEYVNIESSGDFVEILSKESVIFVDESLKPVEDDSKTPGGDSLLYYWAQDAEKLKMWLKIPEKDLKKKIDVKITNEVFKFLAGDDVVLEGNFKNRVVDDVKKDREGHILKIEVKKEEVGLMWDEFLVGDARGEYVPDEGLAAEVHSRLAHLCTDDPSRTSDQPAIGFNAEQLEECDLEGDQNNLQRINLKNRSTTHLAILGTNNRVLFTQNLDSIQRLCIRQDHDGCVWSLLEKPEFNIEHTSTFPGFGYVEASKTNKKFCISPPNGSYVVIVEHIRHALIYEKPEDKAKIAKQRIIDLGAESLPIMGAVATNEGLILLTEDKMYKLKVN